MSDDALEKKHKASSKRLHEQRKKGQVLRSKDFSSGLVLIVSISLLILLAHYIGIIFKHNFVTSFSEISDISSSEPYLFSHIKELFISNLIMLGVIFAVIIAAVLFAPFLFGGWNLTFQAIHLKIDNLSPVNNLKRIISVNTLIEIFKSFLKFIAIFLVLYGFVHFEQREILSLSFFPFTIALMHSTSLVTKFLISICLSIVALAIIDMGLGYWLYHKRLMMTTQEVKDETKETEGNPEVKRKIRSKQLSMLIQALNARVPKANVVVTNPTHYAVALYYDERKDKAPKVIAKGKGAIAQRIRHIASCNGITIYEAPTLARAIYHTTKLGGEIHPELYMAAAIVLSYVHQLKNYQIGRGQLPNVTTDLQIPEAFVFPE